MSDFVQILNCRDEYSENLLSANSVITDNSVIVKTSGSTLSTVEVNGLNFYEKHKSIKIFNDDSLNPLIFYVQNAFNFTTNNDGNYIFSLRVLHKQVTPYDHKLKVNIFYNGLLDHSHYLTIVDTDRNKWLTFAQQFNISSGVDVSMTFEFEINPSDPFGQCELWIGGLKFEYNDRYLGNPSIYTEPRDFYIDTNKEYLGVYDYANTLTAQSFTSTPIYLQNNGLGAFTNLDYAFSNISNLFNTSTYEFDFSTLELGDKVDIRIDVNIQTTNSNQNAKISLELGIGSTPYEISILDRDFKTATTHSNITISNLFYIGNTLTKDNPAKLKFTSDASANVLLNGFAIIVTKRK